MPPIPKRPLSVWITQIILGLYALGTTLLLLWGFYKGLTEGIGNPDLYLVTNVGILAFVAIYSGGFVGMAIRKPWGRWLGVAGIAILLIATAVTQTMQWRAGINEDSGPLSITLIFRVALILGLAFLVYKLAAGDAAEEFFNPRPTER
ncbi:MAG: hypothetical protein IT173_12990 [Acidobacteria bacterium]|nr:hypothetical protein [Acidobacteriota bacterium]